MTCKRSLKGMKNVLLERDFCYVQPGNAVHVPWTSKTIPRCAVAYSVQSFFQIYTRFYSAIKYGINRKFEMTCKLHAA